MSGLPAVALAVTAQTVRAAVQTPTVTGDSALAEEQQMSKNGIVKQHYAAYLHFYCHTDTHKHKRVATSSGASQKQIVFG